MHLIKKILLLSISILFCISCDQSSKERCGSAWIGGEVVNPKREYVIVSQGRKIIDTVPLDKKNFFMYQFQNVDPGLYHFSHNEYQAFYIEPGDSIMLRVNTMEFDESLSFTGKGAPSNNFMIEMFLLNELENEMMPSMYLLSPSDFEHKMDSFSAYRNQLYSEFVAKKESSERFRNIARAAIEYDIYSKKELYLSANARKKTYDESIEIPASFYEFRKNIDLGNDQLRSYYPYYRYLRYYLDNLAYERYEGEEPYDRNSFIHNYHKCMLIDSLITDENLKNSLLRTSAHRYFRNARDKENGMKMLGKFLELSTNDEDHEEVSKFALATVRLTPGHTIPNVMLLTTDNTVKDLHSVVHRSTVLYFWSNKSVKHYRNIHIRASELRSKYPEYDFVGINIDQHFRKWSRVVQNSGYNNLSEFQFENFDDAEMKLIIDSVNKAMIVDKDGKILNGNSNIFDIAIESELLGFLNK